MRSQDFHSVALPTEVRNAATSVLQLKAADHRGCPAVAIHKWWILTAFHVLVDIKVARPMLAIFDSANQQPPNRDVFALDLSDPAAGWRQKIKNNSHSKYGLNDPETLEFAACRLAPNVSGACATDQYSVAQTSERLRDALSPTSGVGVDPNPIYMISYEPQSATKSWSSGLLHQVGGTSFFHSIDGALEGDSGAPIFDIDGKLIGIHVANDEGFAIACRADVIMNTLQSTLQVS